MLWGTINNAASAMNAMSSDLGAISQNIANVNTTGYKGVDTLFQTQLSEHLTDPTAVGNILNPTMNVGAGTDIFGVSAYTRNLISNQGQITTTGQTNDLAINGDGFFVVSPGSSNGAPISASLQNPQAAYYTRAGSFTQTAGPNGQAYYVNDSGDYLMGWMADPTTGAINQNVLTPVYTLPTTTMPAVATTAASLNANIPSDATQTASPQGSSIQVPDDLGHNQTLSLSWSRVNADTWTVSATGVTGGTVGSTAAGATDTYTVTTDSSGNVISMTDGTNTYTPPTQVPFALTWADGTASSASVNLSPLAPTVNTLNTDLPIYDAQSNSHSLALDFEKAGPDSWYLHFDSPELHAAQSSTAAITDPAGASVNMNLTWTPTGNNTYTVSPSSVSGGDSATGSVSVQVIPGTGITAINGTPVSGAANATFNVTTGTGTTAPVTVNLATAVPTFPSISTAPVQLTFNGNGQLVSPQSVNVSATWSDGQTTNTTIDISKLTQFTSGSSNPQVVVNSSSQNGYLSGTLKSTAFQADGTLLGTFSNDQTRVLFQVPLATFVAPNNLTPISGTMFQVSASSGAPTVQAVTNIDGGSAGNSPTQLVAGSVEASNVSLQTQMTDMILAQKAYSTNSQVLQVADQMETVAASLQT